MNNNYCVIMAGGIGSRFWPMSRTTNPKQFIDILGTGESLIQQTFRRLNRISPAENIFVVTNESYRELVKEQLPTIPDDNILGEPMMRNTAPCIAYAAYKIFQANPNANIVVSPSDHIILKEEAFNSVLSETLEAAANSDNLFTLGIKPSRPDTGYGYIQFNDSKSELGNENIKKVKTFTEKPVLEMAKSFIESGDFLWNAGIFIWNVKSILKAFDSYLPDVSDLFKGGLGKYNTDEEKSFISNSYPVCRNISIDYGIMEKANNVYVYVSDFGWSDLGTWGSLYDYCGKDELNNAVMGANVMIYESKNCVINVPDKQLVVLQGLDGFIVSMRDNSLLICRLENEQDLRHIVNDIKIEKGETYV